MQLANRAGWTDEGRGRGIEIARFKDSPDLL